MHELDILMLDMVMKELGSNILEPVPDNGNWELYGGWQIF